MATPRLFRLKAEVAPASSGPQALVLPIARVRVDTGVFHLDQLYDYLVPERLSEDLQVGVRVQVPFGNRETEGIVVERVSTPLITGEIKKISKIISRNQVATSQSLRIYDEVAKIYGCNPWDIIRSAIPPRVASVDKEIYVNESASSRTGKTSSVFFTFAPYSSPDSQIAVQAMEYLKFGTVLIVAPDENDVDNIVRNLENLGIHSVKLTAALNREDRYLNYLISLKGTVKVVVGTRSSIFLPLKNLATIMIFKESSFDHYEVRSPGWNSRIVAETRARLENLNLILSGYSPSSDVALQIDSKAIKYINARTNVSVAAFSPVSGTLLPGRIFADIRNALKSGPVLFLAPRKGYGNALMCSHCKNVALCNCGGRLAVASRNVSPHCVHCGLIYKNWRCNFCNHETKYLLSRGIDRASEEISRAFPGFPVIISNADIIKREVKNRPSLVFSTHGAQPRVIGGYAAVVVLDGTRFFSHTDFRASERGREIFFETSAMLSPTGKALFVIDESNPIVPSVSRWNVAHIIKRELSDRQRLNLPPFSFAIVLRIESSNSTQIVNGLNKAIELGKIPSSTRIYGPITEPKDQSKIVLHCSHSEAQELVEAVHELQRRRSIAKKPLFDLRINPYSLS